MWIQWVSECYNVLKILLLSFFWDTLQNWRSEDEIFIPWNLFNLLPNQWNCTECINAVLCLCKYKNRSENCIMLYMYFNDVWMINTCIWSFPAQHLSNIFNVWVNIKRTVDDISINHTFKELNVQFKTVALTALSSHGSSTCRVLVELFGWHSGVFEGSRDTWSI